MVNKQKTTKLLKSYTHNCARSGHSLESALKTSKKELIEDILEFADKTMKQLNVVRKVKQ